MRTLKQLCDDGGAELPEAVDAVNGELYVADFLSGTDDVESARHRCDQLISLLKAGGLTLKKWVSNSPELLEDVAPEDGLCLTSLQFFTDSPVNKLGMA